jgi:signal transduction histidine kinase
VTTPIPVALTGGFTWTAAFIGLLNVLIGGALVSFIRSRPSLKKIDADREANLLSERAKEMQEMRERILRLEAVQEAKDRLYEAQKAANRHRINNLDAAFQALLLLLKRGVPVEEAVAEIEKLRAEQLSREAAEASIIRAAAIKAGLAEPDL